MNINYLIEYVYLAEMLSFRRTADYFYVSRSVISRHLASLEEEIGTKLIERGPREVQLTDAGKVFYREAQTVLRAYANAVDRTRETGLGSTSLVRIGYLKNAARPVIVRFMRYMSHEHPALQITLVNMEFDELRHALAEGGVDIALAVNVHPALSRNYRSTRIYTDRFYAVTSKEHPLAARTQGIPFEELPRDKLLLPDSFVYAGMGELAEELADERARNAAREYYRDVDALYLKVQTQDYVAFSSGLNNSMFNKSLAIIPITGIDTSFSVSAFYSNGLVPPLFEACRKGFEACQAAMAQWTPESESDFIGFSMTGTD